MRMLPALPLLVLAPFAASTSSAAERKADAAPAPALQAYRAELNQFRQDFGGARELPAGKFFLFGMGRRTKLFFKLGVLRNAASGEVVRQWEVREEIILPAAYSVVMRLQDGGEVRIVEDKGGVWIEEAGRRTAVPGTRTRRHLPDYAEFKYPAVMRVLHQELLVNVLTNGPVPN